MHNPWLIDSVGVDNTVVLMGTPEGTWAFNPRAQSLARALEDFSLSELWDAGFLYTHVPGEQWQQECKELSLGGTDAL